MLKKLQKYIEKCYEQTEKTAIAWRDIENGRARAYGALMFCLDNDLVIYEDIDDYWDKMWNKFQELNERK